jgi:hypothetical protein
MHSGSVDMKSWHSPSGETRSMVFGEVVIVPLPAVAEIDDLGARYRVALLLVKEVREDQSGHHLPFSMACQERKNNGGIDFGLSDAGQFLARF